MNSGSDQITDYVSVEETPTAPLFTDADGGPHTNDLPAMLLEARAQLAALREDGNRPSGSEGRRTAINAGFMPYILERRMDSQGPVPDAPYSWEASLPKEDNDLAA